MAPLKAPKVVVLTWPDCAEALAAEKPAPIGGALLAFSRATGSDCTVVEVVEELVGTPLDCSAGVFVSDFDPEVDVVPEGGGDPTPAICCELLSHARSEAVGALVSVRDAGGMGDVLTLG